MPRYGLWLCFLVFPATLSAGEQAVAVAGDYIEDRSNKVYGCYCEWSGERITGGKEAILGWHIKSGEFRGAPLAGLNLAVVVIGEATLSAGAAPRRSLVFTDSGAPDAQRQAGEAWIKERYGSLLGEIIGAHAVAIEFARDGERALLRIGDMVNVEMRKARPKDDALQGAVLWYDPFIPLQEATLGTTVSTRYQGQEFNHKWDLRDTGISGYFGSFSSEIK